jgi:ribosome maturation factor RimP
VVESVGGSLAFFFLGADQVAVDHASERGDSVDSQPYRIRDKVGLPNAHVERIMVAIVEAVEPFELSPLEVWITNGSLRVTLDHDVTAPSLEVIASASKAISARLDLEGSIDFLQERYELEISSPGIERPLLNERQLVRAKGSLVEIELRDAGRSQRLRGHLLEVAGGQLVMVLEVPPSPTQKKGQRPKVGETVTLSLADVDSAKTVFEWPGWASSQVGSDLASFGDEELDPLLHEDLEEDEDNGTQ